METSELEKEEEYISPPVPTTLTWTETTQTGVSDITTCPFYHGQTLYPTLSNINEGEDEDVTTMMKIMKEHSQADKDSSSDAPRAPTPSVTDSSSYDTPLRDSSKVIDINDPANDDNLAALKSFEKDSSKVIDVKKNDDPALEKEKKIWCDEKQDAKKSMDPATNDDYNMDLSDDDVIIGVQPLPSLNNDRSQGTTETSLPGAYARPGRARFSRRPEDRPEDPSTTPTTDVESAANSGSGTVSSGGTGDMIEDGSDIVAEANLVDDSNYANAEEMGQNTETVNLRKKTDLFAYSLLGCLLIVVAIGAGMLGIFFTSNQASPTAPQDSPETETDPNGPASSSTMAGAAMEDIEAYVLGSLPQATVDSIHHGGTHQAKAFEWLMSDGTAATRNVESFMEFYPEWRVRQRMALATLYHSTKGEYWTKNDGWLNHGIHECYWYFSSLPDRLLQMPLAMKQKLLHYSPTWFETLQEPICGRAFDGSNNWNGIIRQLRLFRNNLEGTLPDEIYWLLPELTGITVMNNNLQGTISQEVAQAKQLKLYDFTNCHVSGTLPTELELLSDTLFTLSFLGNDLDGTVPTELGLLQELEGLFLEYNQLTGTVPSELGLMTSATMIFLTENNLSGSIPSNLGQLTASLRDLDVAVNNLSGPVPWEEGLSELIGSDNLKYLNISANPLLSGIVPEDSCAAAAANSNDHGRIKFSWACTASLCGCNCTCGEDLQSSSSLVGEPFNKTTRT